MPKRILIVDDEPDLVRVTSFRLEKSGYEVLTCLSGKDAMDVIQKQQPDLILLDLFLPVVMGDVICRQLKADKELKRIPVIIFTATAVNILDKVEQAQADDYLAKPFSPEELMQKVERFLGEKKNG